MSTNNSINSMLNGSSLTGPLHENFESERTNATKAKTEVDNLLNLLSTSNNFQGDIWKNVSTKLTDYSDNLQLRINSSNKLEAAMVKALTLIKNYMGDYEELDDSKLPELKYIVLHLPERYVDIGFLHSSYKYEMQFIKLIVECIKYTFDKIRRCF